MRVARVVLATLALIASASVALDDAGDAAAPSPAVNPGASAEAAGGFPIRACELYQSRTGSEYMWDEYNALINKLKVYLEQYSTD